MVRITVALDEALAAAAGSRRAEAYARRTPSNSAIRSSFRHPGGHQEHAMLNGLRLHLDRLSMQFVIPVQRGTANCCSVHPNCCSVHHGPWLRVEIRCSYTWHCSFPSISCSAARIARRVDSEFSRDDDPSCMPMAPLTAHQSADCDTSPKGAPR